MFITTSTGYQSQMKTSNSVSECSITVKKLCFEEFLMTQENSYGMRLREKNIKLYIENDLKFVRTNHRASRLYLHRIERLGEHLKVSLVSEW